MAKGDFKKRLNAGVKLIIDELKLDPPCVGRLYTPVWRDRKYQWISPMDSDGLLVKERNIASGKETADDSARLRIGVIIQSEFTTSRTKPNPFGKALVDTLPFGVWVDLWTGDARRRVRLDRVFVLFVMPRATAQSKKWISKIAKEYVENAADAATEAHMLEVPMGAGGPELATLIGKSVRPWLVGAGRPAGT